MGQAAHCSCGAGALSADDTVKVDMQGLGVAVPAAEVLGAGRGCRAEAAAYSTDTADFAAGHPQQDTLQDGFRLAIRRAVEEGLIESCKEPGDTALPGVWHCPFCCVDLHVSRLDGHLSSQRHQRARENPRYMVAVKDMLHHSLGPLQPWQKKAASAADGCLSGLEDVPSLPAPEPPPLMPASVARPPRPRSPSMAYESPTSAAAAALTLQHVSHGSLSYRTAPANESLKQKNLRRAQSYTCSLNLENKRMSCGNDLDFRMNTDRPSTRSSSVLAPPVLNSVMEQLFRKHEDLQRAEEQKRAEQLERLRREKEEIDRERWAEHERIQARLERKASLRSEASEARKRNQAVRERREAVANFLVENGFVAVTVKRKRAFFSTYPLHVAAEQGDAQMVKYLLEENADPQVKNSSGRTPAQIAQRKNKYGSHDAVLEALGLEY